MTQHGFAFSPVPDDCIDGGCCTLCHTQISVCFCCPFVDPKISSGIVRQYMNLDTYNAGQYPLPAENVPCMVIQLDGTVIIRGSGKVSYRGIETTFYPYCFDINATTHCYPDIFMLDVVDGDVLSNFTTHLIAFQDDDCIYKHTGYGPGGFTAEGCECFPVSEGGIVDCESPQPCESEMFASVLSGPSMLARARNFTRAVVRHGLNLFRKRSKPEVAALYLICAGGGAAAAANKHSAKCGYFDPKRKICSHGLCGCNVNNDDEKENASTAYFNKLRWRSEHCPVGKW